MSPALALSVRNTFVHVVGVDENDSCSEEEGFPTARRSKCRSKTVPNASFDLKEESDDGVDTTDVTESSALSSDIEPSWDGNASEHGHGTCGVDSIGGKKMEKQSKAKRTVRFASPCSEGSNEEPAYVDDDIVRERRGRRRVTWHVDLDSAPKEEPMFVPLPGGSDSEGQRRRRVATWHGASSELVEDMLEEPTIGRVVTRDSFESPTACQAHRGADPQESDESTPLGLSRAVTRDFFDDDSPLPGLSHAITRDFFDSQDLPCDQQGHVCDSSVPNTSPPPPTCDGMVQPACFVHPWMLDVNAFAQWSMMMAACHQVAEPHANFASGAKRQRNAKPSKGGGLPRTSDRVRSDRRHLAGSDCDASQRTTVMLRNLPNNYTRDNVLKLLDKQGFCGKYDFVYCPVDFDTGAALGYAFVNLVSTADAEALMETLEGFYRWHVPSDKICTVAWSQHSQGLDTHVQRYRNSPLMHKLVPDEYRPVLFQGGERIAFPTPTKAIKAPRKGTRLMLV